MDLKSIVKSEFTKNVLKLFSGTALGNAIGFAALPLLTRIFTKNDLGDFQLFLSTITTLSVIASLKFELTIVLPKDDKEGNDLVLISLISLLIFSFFTSVLFIFFGSYLLSLLGASKLEPYLFFLSIGIFLMGLMQALQYVLIRNKYFGELATNKLFQIASTQVVAIGFGIFYPSFVVLFLAQMAGFALASFLILRKHYIYFRKLNLSMVWFYFKKYKKFPTVNTSMVFLNTLSLQLPVFMFSRYFSSEVVGLYMVANRLMTLPLNMIGRSFSQVYFQSASEAFHEGKNKLMKIYKKTVKQLAAIGILPIIVIIFAAPPLTAFFLGSEWREAGVFMQIITFWIYFQFINMPISSTFTIIDRQEIGFILITVSLIIRFGAMYIFHATPREMLIAQSVSAGLFYIMYNLSIAYFISRIK